MPPAPTGAGSAGLGGGSGFGMAFVAMLMLMGGLAAQRFSRMVLAPARGRPVAFVWLLERPG
jgi:hypothetical protein